MRLSISILLLLSLFFTGTLKANQLQKTMKAAKHAQRKERQEARIQKLLHSKFFQHLLAKAEQKAQKADPEKKTYFKNPNLLTGILLIVLGIGLLFVPVALLQVLGGLSVIIGLVFILISFVP